MIFVFFLLRHYSAKFNVGCLQNYLFYSTVTGEGNLKVTYNKL